MRKQIHQFLTGFHDTTMFLALMVWLCVAPLVLALTLPFFGWQGSLTAITMMFLIILT